MTTKLKTLVLGLDGATWDLLDPLSKLGVIPALTRLMENGAKGVLHSTLPPLTGPAWTTFATGKNPGQHGFFDWGIIDSQYRAGMWNVDKLNDQFFWERLSDSGRKVGVFHMPYSYPASPVNGFVFCGLGTPSTDGVWNYPSEDRPELEAIIGDEYSFNFQLLAYPVDEYNRLVDDLIALENIRTEALFHLTEKHQPDDLVAIYTGPDRVGHFLGHAMDFSAVTDPDDVSPEQAAIVRYYRALDKHIARIEGLVDEETALVMISDHGFTTTRKNFHINDWLRGKGFLSTTLFSFLKSQLAFLSGMLQRESNQQVQKQNSDSRTGVDKIRLERRFDTGVHLGQQIVWGRTRAFSNSHNGIYINAVGRFNDGIVQPGADYERVRTQIISELMKVTDPDTGQPILEEVVRREDIYQGDNLHLAPDLLLRYRDEAYTSNRYFFAAQDFGLRIGLSLFRRPSHWSRGDHHRDGIVLLRHPDKTRKGNISPLEMHDVAPTILHLLGQPVPSGMTGKVALHAFADGMTSVNAVDDPAARIPSGEGEMSAEEEYLVYERLRELGYLD